MAPNRHFGWGFFLREKEGRRLVQIKEHVFVTDFSRLMHRGLRNAIMNKIYGALQDITCLQERIS